MLTGKFELIVCWDSGETSIYEYETREDAEIAEDNMMMANGDQIAWTGIRRQTTN